MELVRFKEKYFLDLIQCIESQDFLVQWAGLAFTYPLTKEQLQAYINKENNYVFAAIEMGEVIGHIALNHDVQNDCARIGKVLIKKTIRGKGIGAKMMKKACNFAFYELYCHKVTLGVFEYNKSAKSCYEKVGFQVEGILKDARKNGKEYLNLIEMGMLKYEYERN